ncbi:MAG: hypothetical protein ABSE40_20715 [Candidatus Sulfotelmatobacter sp.]|jgi:hypothetical protein
MEGITRIVSESLARHGFDRPLDYRRLHWSRWFRCQSHHSLLVVPSKPGVFALAEEIMSVGTAALGCPAERSSAGSAWDRVSDPVGPGIARLDSAASTDTPAQRRMLAVTQVFADDDMAFVLDRMLSRENPMRARLVSGHYFVRFVIIEDEAQRRSICNALNQWIADSGEKISGIGAHFATSLELTETRVVAGGSLAAVDVALKPAAASASATAEQVGNNGSKPTALPATTSQLDSGSAANIHCPAPFPSGF